MPNLPEVTKPIWSTERPTFEEVKGKSLYIETIYTNPHYVEIISQSTFEKWFDDTFVRYCILDLSTPEEPMEYKGCKPAICENHLGWYATWCAGDMKGELHDIGYFPTRELAIHSWNRFVKAMEAVNE